MMRTEAECQELLNAALPDGPDSPYEMGVQDTLDWVMCVSEEKPL